MITYEMLKKIAPAGRDQILRDLSYNLNEQLAAYGINNYLRISHFLAQAAHESAGFKVLEEYASGGAYEGRKDLGNTQAGDGKRYKGRGIFQLTGRANYRALGQKLGIDLENNPALAAVPINSIKIACEYWNSRGISALADKDDVVAVTKKINGGTNGLEDRKIYLSKAKSIIPKSISLVQAKTADKPPVAPTSAINVVVAKKGDKSPYVADLQQMLVKKGATIKVDGDFGPATESAVRFFQVNNGLNATGSIDTNTLNKLMV